MSNAPDERPVYGTKEYWRSECDRQLDRARFWEANSCKYHKESEYYRTELAKAHALLGRIVHQASERWDSLRITEYYPTDNLHNKRGDDD